jgi:hypothetical protein
MIQFEIVNLTETSTEWHLVSYCRMCSSEIAEGSQYAYCQFADYAFNLCNACIPLFVKEVRIKLDPNIRAFT